jgi:hypothetical protein
MAPKEQCIIEHQNIIHFANALLENEINQIENEIENEIIQIDIMIEDLEEFIYFISSLSDEEYQTFLFQENKS